MVGIFLYIQKIPSKILFIQKFTCKNLFIQKNTDKILCIQNIPYKSSRLTKMARLGNPLVPARAVSWNKVYDVTYSK